MERDNPLLVAAREGRADAVKKLIRKGGKPIRDSWNHTALHLCAIDGHTDVAELLLAHGLDANARNKSGSTPLLMAAEMFAGPAFFRVLLAHGADASARDTDGKSALDLIFKRVDGQGQPLTQKRIAISRLLIKHGAPAAPDQARRVGGAAATTLAATVAAFDWAALETHLLATSTKAIAAFAKRHRKELFYGFCFDCNAQAHGDVTLCLNTVERLERNKALKWSPGDWAHQEFANMDAKWRARVAPLGDDDGIDPKVAERLLQSIARVALRLLETGAFSTLRRTDDFDVFVLDHEETFEKARARMKRVRGAAPRPRARR